MAVGKTVSSPGSALATLSAAGATGALVVFSLRRLALLAAALVPARMPRGREGTCPAVTLVVPARNEGARIEAVLRSLDELEYPRSRLTVVLVDDASEDETGARMTAWAERREGVVAVRLTARAGRFQAVNRGIAAAPPSEIVAVCDGDLR